MNSTKTESKYLLSANLIQGWTRGFRLPIRRHAFDVIVVVIAACLTGLSGCGYMIGPAFPPTVSTVYVPVVQSGSDRRDLEYQLTEAVQREIKQRSGIRLAKPPYAQTKLTVRIIELGKSVLGETQHDDPRELQVRLAVSATWEDLRTGQILAQEQLSLAPAVRQIEATGEFSPELGHSMATGTQRSVTQVAARVVDLMEIAW